jgi:hypothetical protein
VNRELVQRIWQRAGNCCEYCKLPARHYPLPFQVDHIIAKQHGGASELANLALSCLHCNVSKGPNVAGIDPVTGQLTRLYHPRTDTWAEHFLWSGAELTGKTAIGRVTAYALGMNEPDFQEVRFLLICQGLFPQE